MMTHKIAFLFPGQGSQEKNMGLDLLDSYPQAKERIQHSQAILGWSLEEIVTAEDDRLNTTLYTQPALYIVSSIIVEILAEAGFRPTLVAGHSAGEYPALTFAKAWDFETGLKVIAERARLMHKNKNPGAMAAIIGLDSNTIEETCSQAEGIVQIAALNSPKQTVITGEVEAIDSILPILKEKGARRATKLKTSGAFHSPLMKEAQEQLETYLADIKIRSPEIPLVSNNTGKAVTEAEPIRQHLVKQLGEPVQWVKCMQFIEKECESAIEVGPGKVLTGLAKACCHQLPCANTATLDGVRKVMDEYDLGS